MPSLTITRVTRINEKADRVMVNDGMIVLDLMGNVIKQGPKKFDVPRQFTPAEFNLGKKWTAAFVVNRRGKQSSVHFDVQIASREKVSVPAGTFDSFKIVASGWNETMGALIEVTLWLVPGVNFPLKTETLTRTRSGQMKVTERHELVALRQQVFKRLPPQ